MKELSILLMGMSLIFMFVIAVVLCPLYPGLLDDIQKGRGSRMESPDTVLRHLYRV